MTKTAELETRGRVPPQDIDAEKSLLGSMLFSAAAYDDAIQSVRADCFYSDANKRIFAALCEMYERGIHGVDVVTLANELKKRKDLDEIGGVAYLNDIMGTVPHAVHAPYYAKIVRDKWLQRSLIETCERTLRETYEGTDDLDDLLARSEKRMFAILEQVTSIDQGNFSSVLDDTFKRLFDRMDMTAETGATTGLATGLSGLDDLTSGMQPTELIILAARPSMGKTAMVCNFALTVAKAGKGVLVFSLEQSKLELAERMLCIEAKVSGHKLRKGELDEFDQSAVMEAAEAMRGYHLHLDDVAGRTVSQIGAIARRAKRRGQADLIIIDYLQLCESDDRNLPREQQISTTTRRLKALAKDLNVPVLALSQLNRGLENREDKKPRLGDLRESGAIEQDADIVMFLHRPEAYDPEDRPGEADLIIAKNRHGPIGTCELVWLKEMLRFGDKAPKYLDP